MGFVQSARRIRLPELDRWLDKTEPIMAQQVVLKRYPVTTGALENKLRIVKARLEDRRWQFGNRERMDRLLMLMQLELNGHAVERNWAQLIRKALEAHGGVAPLRREIMDKRGHSLRAKATPSSRATRKHRRKMARQRKQAKRRSALGPAP